MDTTFIENSFIQKYHLQMISEAGINSASALGWKSREAQLVRFEAIAQAADMTGSSVLDVGCGTGDLRAFLAAKYGNIRYTGADQMEPFLQLAVERYHDWPDTTFLHADIGDATLPAADYVIASGTLSYKHAEDGYIHRMIKKLHNCAHKALIFNLLSSLPEPAPLLSFYEPDAIVNFCKTLSDDVIVNDKYREGDFMVRVGR
jgi:SAM-dependent methyltransferase